MKYNIKITSKLWMKVISRNFIIFAPIRQEYLIFLAIYGTIFICRAEKSEIIVFQ